MVIFKMGIEKCGNTFLVYSRVLQSRFLQLGPLWNPKQRPWEHIRSKV